MARITNLKTHLAELVSAYEAANDNAIAAIIADARETLTPKPVPEFVPNSVIPGDDGEMWIDLGTEFTRIDGADYDAVKGIRWKLSRDGYAVKESYGSGYSNMHRVLMQPPSHLFVDHIDGNKLDNRRCNLRLATPSQNAHNRGPSRNNTSGFKGVIYVKREKKWRAKMTVQGKPIQIGDFKNKDDAVRAYAAASEKYHGEFARYEI